MWECLCICGETIVTSGSSLRNGSTKSCGCLKREGNNLKHGYNRCKKRTPTYSSWSGMKTRCNNISGPKYNKWGGRGIRICNRWSKFENFLKDMGSPPTKSHSLDRINNNKGYCKSNCRWATPKQQGRNKSNNRIFTFKRKTQCLSAWSEEYKIKSSIIADRLNRGWSTKEALTVPIKGKRSV